MPCEELLFSKKRSVSLSLVFDNSLIIFILNYTCSAKMLTSLTAVLWKIVAFNVFLPHEMRKRFCFHLLNSVPSSVFEYMGLCTVERKRIILTFQLWIRHKVPIDVIMGVDLLLNLYILSAHICPSIIILVLDSFRFGGDVHSSTGPILAYRVSVVLQYQARYT